MIIALAALAVAGQPFDADADGWDMMIDPDHGRVASAAWASGQAVLVRCKAGRLDVIVNGLPPAETRSRRIEMTLGEVGPETQSWATAPGSPIASPPEPARIARLMADGGDLDLRVMTTGGEATYGLPLPSDGAGVRDVLQACNQLTTGEHDRLPRLAETATRWTRKPVAVLPPRFGKYRFVAAEARLGCLIDADGRPSSCWVEGETPSGKGVGPAAVASTMTARFEVPDDGKTGFRIIRFDYKFEARFH
ncbi:MULTISPECIES: hypothetical protein [unclassified Brevundimonas]|uniref:hypothetical protein n=1 Tax=unclassified Brevundimonas TaxID=2622653 RepID=UPI003F920FC6